MGRFCAAASRGEEHHELGRRSEEPKNQLCEIARRRVEASGELGKDTSRRKQVE